MASTNCSPRPTSSRYTRQSRTTPSGMIGADQFAKMRDGAVFLNTARAQLHDTDALVDALRSGKVGAAGLDHFVGEVAARRPSAHGHAQRRAHAPYRRGHVEH